jgi:hypothetical protein
MDGGRAPFSSELLVAGNEVAALAKEAVCQRSLSTYGPCIIPKR